MPPTKESAVNSAQLNNLEQRLESSIDRAEERHKEVMGSFDKLTNAVNENDRRQTQALHELDMRVERRISEQDLKFSRENNSIVTRGFTFVITGLMGIISIGLSVLFFLFTGQKP